MNDPESLWQDPAVTLVALLVVLLVGVWILKRMTSLISALQHQGPEGFLAALDQMFPRMRRSASPPLVKAICKALGRKLRLPPEMISSHTVRDQLGAYGVSPETILLLEQVLRSEEAKKYGPSAPPLPEITFSDVWKVARELEERLPKY